MKRDYILIVVVFLVVVAPLIQWGVSSWWSDGARMATIQAIVEEGTFKIDNTYFVETGDKFYYKGNYYSEKPPILQIYASIFYAILYYVFNITMNNNDGLVYFILTFFTIATTSAIGLVYFYKIAIFFDLKREEALLLTFIAAFGTFMLPYSTIFNNHITAGSLITISFYYLLRVRERLLYPIISGSLLSIAGGIDINSFFLIPFALIILYRESFKKMVAFFLAATPVTLLYLYFNYLISGSIMPPALNWKLFEFTGSAFEGKMMDGMSGHTDLKKLVVYIFDLLFWNRGLFLHIPVTIFSIIGAFFILKDKNFKYKRYFIYIFIPFLLLVFLMLFRTVDYGGNCFGPRRVGLFFPILILPVMSLLNKIRESKMFLLFFIFITLLSIAVSVLGSVDAFTKTEYGLNSILNCFMVFLKSGYIFQTVVISVAIFLFSLFFLLLRRVVKKSS